MSPGKWRPFCLSLNVLKSDYLSMNRVFTLWAGLSVHEAGCVCSGPDWLLLCTVNSFVAGGSGSDFKSIIFKCVIENSSFDTQCEIALQENTKEWEVNTGSGNGLVPSGTKPSPEPMLTQIYVAIWRRYRSQWGCFLNSRHK